MNIHLIPTKLDGKLTRLGIRLKYIAFGHQCFNLYIHLHVPVGWY